MSEYQIPEEVAALISAHALGALDADQAALAERHIAASDDCRRAYEDALETAAALALAVADSEPPADLRDRIVAAARAERPPVAEAKAARAAPKVPPRRAAHAVDRLRRDRRRGRDRVRADRGVAARLGLERQGRPAGAGGDPVGSRRPRRAAEVGRRRSGGRSHDRVQEPRSARQLPPECARRPHVSGLGPAPRWREPVPLPTFSGDGDVVILDDVGQYDGVGVTAEPSGGSQKPSAAPFAVATL